MHQLNSNINKTEGARHKCTMLTHQDIVKLRHSVCPAYLQAVEGLPQIAYAASLSRCVFWGVLTL